MMTYTPNPPVGSGSGEQGKFSFLSEVCLPLLRRAQNSDGGWGHRQGAPSSIEATCWALLALGHLEDFGLPDETAVRGAGWLTRTQLSDGGWPAMVEQRQGCWVTALAGLALQACACAPEAVERGVGWLLRAWPGEGGWWWRARNCWRRQQSPVRQQTACRGWSWTAGTSSWVEPTSYALLLLRQISPDSGARRAARRRQLGEAMLWDRVCPGGGWNCGNPFVYGAAGHPEVIPTAWALLALRNHRDRREVRKSLAWLEQTYGDIQGPGSLAMAHFCLKAYGRTVPVLEPALRNLYERNEFLGSVRVLAWAAMALSPAPRWLPELPPKETAK